MIMGRRKNKRKKDGEIKKGRRKKKKKEMFTKMHENKIRTL